MPSTNPITIIDYRPEWTDEFTAIAGSLHEALGNQALHVEHIGSTAVPGLAAKDVIDVQVTVTDFTPELETAFQQAGYARLAGITQDHVPPTATGLDRDGNRNWEKQMYRPTPGARPANIHVRRTGSANERYALLFRNYLRTHPLASQAYAQAKQALARHGPDDWDLYYDVKDPICDIIMAGAEDWAASTSWHIELLA